MEELEKNEELKFSSELSKLFEFIQTDLSIELPTLKIDVNYFLLGSIIQKNNKLFSLLESCMMTSEIEAIYSSWYQLVASKALTAVKSNRKPIIDSKLNDIFNNADKERQSLNADEVDSLHVFLAILNDDSDDNKIRKVFNKASVTYTFVKNKISDIGNIDSFTKKINKKDIKESKFEIIIPPEGDVDKILDMVSDYYHVGFDGSNTQDKTAMYTMQTKSNSYINQYCTNLNNLVERGQITPVIGRDREIQQLIRILGRKKKNNAILLGGEGVGKTAIGEFIAWKIVNGEVPEFLSNKQLVSLDMTALMAGTTLRGMFEERVKGILDEIKDNPNFILFMDNIGAVLADKSKNDFEISAMLSRSLENGELQVIGTSDFTSYRKTFDKDPSLARRFQKILVEAPTVDESLNILFGLRESYETFHNVKYTDDAISSCVMLANRYICERNLPDSAIDLVDESGAFFSTIQEPESMKVLRKKIKDIQRNINALKRNGEFSNIDNLENELKDCKIKYKEERDTFENNRKNNPIIIDKNNILDIVSQKTNIPVTNLTSDDKHKLSTMNDRLKSEVIGQDEAIDTICKALKRNRLGLHKNGCMFSAMAIGKSGVGKTFLAKKLAKELFGDEKSMVRFDMSEFSDKVAVNKLIGSNPGYVGYEEGGQLTEAIKNKKHCVLLLDEIEKADPEIYNVFLQVLDEGFLTDNSGQKIDFKNVIIIFTSNIGAKAASDFSKGIGFTEDEDSNSKKILFKQLKSKFPPEFLNRIDNIIYFNSLTTDNLKTIISLEMSKLNENIENIGYKLQYDDEIFNVILDEIKEEKNFGARPIRRAIQTLIEDKICDVLLENEYEEGYVFKIMVDDMNNVVIV